MNSFYTVHENCKIGYKLLSPADLGTNNSSHQTHIGLHGASLDYLRNFERNSISTFVYEDKSEELLCLLDFISRADGTIEAPKIRKGSIEELNYKDEFYNSIVREIREIVKSDGSKYKWYLMWFGLENEDLVFFLFKEASKDFQKILDIIGTLKIRDTINNSSALFNKIIDFFENKIDEASLSLFVEIEKLIDNDD